MDLLSKLFDVNDSIVGKDVLTECARKIFEMETSYGLPPEISWDKITTTHREDDERLFIAWEYLNLITDHKVKSGIGGKRLKALQERNRKVLERLLTTGSFDL